MRDVTDLILVSLACGFPEKHRAFRVPSGPVRHCGFVTAHLISRHSGGSDPPGPLRGEEQSLDQVRVSHLSRDKGQSRDEVDPVLSSQRAPKGRTPSP